MSFNQSEYINKYNKDKYKTFIFRIKKSDDSIISFLEKEKNKNNYFYSLLDKDINKKVYTIKQLKQIIKPIMKKYGIEEIYLFGSYSRGEATPSSDVDIYCEKGNIRTLLDQGRLEEELENGLNKSVDIVFIGSQMNDYFKNQIMEDMIKLC